jgi:hypothetical protein
LVGIAREVVTRRGRTMMLNTLARDHGDGAAQSDEIRSEAAVFEGRRGQAALSAPQVEYRPLKRGSEKTNNELEKIGAKIKKHRGFRIRFWLP